VSKPLDEVALADSRGFEIGVQNVNGVVGFLLTRTIALVDRKYYGFETMVEAIAFLKEQAEVPHFRVKVTYGDGAAEVVELYAWKTRDAMVQVADAASRRRPNYRLKSLEIL